MLECEGSSSGKDPATAFFVDCGSAVRVMTQHSYNNVMLECAPNNAGEEPSTPATDVWRILKISVRRRRWRGSLLQKGSHFGRCALGPCAVHRGCLENQVPIQEDDCHPDLKWATDIRERGEG